MHYTYWYQISDLNILKRSLINFILFLFQYRRAHIPDAAEKINYGDRSHKHYEATIKQQPRAPFSNLAQNLPDEHEASDDKISRNGNVLELVVDLILVIVVPEMEEQKGLVHDFWSKLLQVLEIILCQYDSLFVMTMQPIIPKLKEHFLKRMIQRLVC